MIDLSKVKVTGGMLRQWQKARKKDPLAADNLTTDDILYAYYLMAKTKNPNITEDEAYDDIETGQLIEVMKAFFPALATPKKVLESLEVK